MYRVIFTSTDFDNTSTGFCKILNSVLARFEKNVLQLLQVFAVVLGCSLYLSLIAGDKRAFSWDYAVAMVTWFTAD